MSQVPDKTRNWCFTINNPVEEPILPDTAKYIVYGREKAPQTGTPHLQGFVMFKNAVRLTTVSKLFPTAHLEMTIGTWEQAATYCKKDGDYIEYGEPPVSNKRKGEMQKERWDIIKKQAQANQLEDIEPGVYVNHYRTLKAIAKDHMKRPADLPAVCGRWYHGESGKGKTTAARAEFPDAYIKSRDKWWDGYQGENVIILDDLDKYHVSLAAHLKDWADKWTFKAEEKGTYTWIRPGIFIVTSQYHPSDIWEDQETLAAIYRRYEIKEP